MADRIYCYPNSDVLINKLNIRDMDRLQNFERRLTMLRLSELLDRPMAGKFDFEHLQRIQQLADEEDRAGRSLDVHENIQTWVSGRDSYETAIEMLKSVSAGSNEKPGVLVLNFANPVHPGGGVTRGANAQEEDLCRRSTLSRF